MFWPEKKGYSTEGVWTCARSLRLSFPQSRLEMTVEDGAAYIFWAVLRWWKWHCVLVRIGEQPNWVHRQLFTGWSSWTITRLSRASSGCMMTLERAVQYLESKMKGWYCLQEFRMSCHDFQGFACFNGGQTVMQRHALPHWGRYWRHPALHSR